MVTAFGPWSTACQGKIRFTVKRAAKRARREREQQIGRMDVYRCPFCHHWHLGHRPARPRKNNTPLSRGDA